MKFDSVRFFVCSGASGNIASVCGIFSTISFWNLIFEGQIRLIHGGYRYYKQIKLLLLIIRIALFEWYVYIWWPCIFGCAEPLSCSFGPKPLVNCFVLCCTVQCSTLWCLTGLCYIVLNCIVLYRALHCNTDEKKKRSTKFKGHTLINPKNTPFQYISKRGQNLISMTQPTNKCNKTTLFFYLNKRYEWNVIEWNVSNEMSTNK